MFDCFSSMIAPVQLMETLKLIQNSASMWLLSFQVCIKINSTSRACSTQDALCGICCTQAQRAHPHAINTTRLEWKQRIIFIRSDPLGALRCFSCETQRGAEQFWPQVSGSTVCLPNTWQDAKRSIVWRRPVSVCALLWSWRAIVQFTAI